MRRPYLSDADDRLEWSGRIEGTGDDRWLVYVAATGPDDAAPLIRSAWNAARAAGTLPPIGEDYCGDNV